MTDTILEPWPGYWLSILPSSPALTTFSSSKLTHKGSSRRHEPPPSPRGCDTPYPSTCLWFRSQSFLECHSLNKCLGVLQRQRTFAPNFVSLELIILTGRLAPLAETSYSYYRVNHYQILLSLFEQRAICCPSRILEPKTI